MSRRDPERVPKDIMKGVVVEKLLGKALQFMILLSLTGCTVRITKDISERLNTDELNKSFNVTPSDLSLKSKCQKKPTIKIVNTESRIEEYEAMINPPITGVINPKEMMDAVVLYLGEGYKQSHISVDDKSTKLINIKMIDLKATAGVWTFGSHFKTELVIPETGLTKSYESNEGSMIAYTANAYAIHSAIRQIIDDPSIQNYILCNAEPSDSLSNQKEGTLLHGKLQELQTAFDKGLISKEEFQLKRKELLERF
jgi:hypothetical protein